MKGFEIFSNEVKTTLNEIVTNVINWFDGENVDKVEEFDVVETLINKGYDDEGDGKFEAMVDYIVKNVETIAYNSKFGKGESYKMGKTYCYYEPDGRPEYDEAEIEMYDCLSFDEDGVIRVAYEFDY